MEPRDGSRPLTVAGAATYLSVCSLHQPGPMALENTENPWFPGDEEGPTSGQDLSAKGESLIRKRLLNTP